MAAKFKYLYFSGFANELSSKMLIISFVSKEEMFFYA